MILLELEETRLHTIFDLEVENTSYFLGVQFS